jgi:hypothetical protein
VPVLLTLSEVALGHCSRVGSIPGVEGAAPLGSSNLRADALKALEEHLGVAATSAASVRRSAPTVGPMFR